MSERDQFDNLNNENGSVNITSDTYTTESSADIYNTPDVSGSMREDTSTEEVSYAEVVVEDASVSEVVVEIPSSEEIVEAEAVVPYGSNAYSGQMPPGGNQGSPYTNNPYNSNPYNNSPYNNNPYNYNPHNNNPYSNNQYGNNPYGGQMPPNGNQGGSYNNNPYNGSPYNNSPYNNNPYNGSPYNGIQYGNNPYNTQYGNQYNSSQYNGNQYNSNSYNNNQNNQYNSNSYNNNQNSQNSNQYNNNQYANNPYEGQNTQNNGPSGNPPYNNQYSPYAAPPKKNKNGLVIGIVIGIIVLFFIAIFALVYRAMTIFTQNNSRTRSSRDEYEFDYDDWGMNRKQKERDPSDGYDDDYDDDWYDDWYGDDYDDDSEYYELHDDIRTDLSYSVDMDYYEYDTNNDNVDIWATYPTVAGKDVPNLDKLNDAIQDEIDFFVDIFDEEFEDYLIGEDDYYEAYVMGYVTYMDEEKISIVFDERIYSTYYDDVYLYCINFDIKNGVILDNKNMLSIDDNFSVDFRERSDIQNGEIAGLTWMSDQQITKYFNSMDIIVFYTPMGMEIGFNYEDGWVTVTYSDYGQYLKVF